MGGGTWESYGGIFSMYYQHPHTARGECFAISWVLDLASSCQQHTFILDFTWLRSFSAPSHTKLWNITVKYLNNIHKLSFVLNLICHSGNILSLFWWNSFLTQVTHACTKLRGFCFTCLHKFSIDSLLWTLFWDFLSNMAVCQRGFCVRKHQLASCHFLFSAALFSPYLVA